MSTRKLSSDEVPQKFIDWLLAVGCPAEKIPSLEKMTRMCRGQYYMAWRSLLEHVQAKDVIRYKRLTVFYDDIRICRDKNLLRERSSSAEIPVQLSLWKDHTDLKEKVIEAEARVSLNELMDKISRKVSQRDAKRQHLQNLERRSWLLSRVADDLTAKISNLQETVSIAGSMCNIDDKQQDDIQNKIDKCMGNMQKKKSGNLSVLPLSTPVASSSIVSNNENDTANNNKDDPVLSLVECRADILWPHLCERRAALNLQLSQAYSKPTDVRNKRPNVRLILAHTAALRSTLALEVIKNKVNIKHTFDMSAASIENIVKYASGDAFEVLVLLVQRTYIEARVRSLRTSLEELTSKRGIFDCGGPVSPVLDDEPTLGKVASVTKSIVNSRDELRRLISSLASIERKVSNTRECLLAVFSALHNNTTVSSDRSWGIQLDFPVEPIPLLRQFFTKRCDRNRTVGNLSWNLEMSDSSFVETTENPTFVDELKVYLEKFHLEKNRKLVLDSGEKIWIFETLQSLSSRLQARWLEDDVTPLLCPSVLPSRALRYLHETLEEEALGTLLEVLSTKHTCNFDIDITAISQQEAHAVDKIKKQISENLNLLQKVHKNLDGCHENLEFWSEHQLRRYISPNRTVNGKTYKEFEALYLDRLKLNS